MFKKLAHSALFVVCAIRAYRDPYMSPHVDCENGLGETRQQTSWECASTACVNGAVMAQEIIESLMSAWS